MHIQWMVRLYPSAWQERYGPEIRIVLEQHKPTLKTWFDLAINALDAHLDPASWGQRSFIHMENRDRLRRSNSIIFLTFTAMLLAYVIFLSDLSDVLDRITRNASLTDFLNNTLSSILNIQVVALLIALLLVTSAIAFQKGATSSKYLKFIPLILVLLPTVMATIDFGCQFLPGDGCHFGWDNFIFASLLVCVPLVAAILVKSNVSQRILKITSVPLALIVVGMVVQILGTFTRGILAWNTSQLTVAQFTQKYDRTFLPGDYHIWLAVGLALVLLCGGMAVAALIHSLHAWENKDNSSPQLESIETP